MPITKICRQVCFGEGDERRCRQQCSEAFVPEKKKQERAIVGRPENNNLPNIVSKIEAPRIQLSPTNTAGKGDLVCAKINAECKKIESKMKSAASR